MESIYSNDFFDKKFSDRELPEDFFSDVLSERVSQEPSLLTFVRPFLLDNEVTSIYGDYDYDMDTFSVGCKDVNEPLYYIKADYSVAGQVYDWYRKLLDNPVELFPNIGVANIVIPPNKIEQREKVYSLEKRFVSKGCIIYNPSYSLHIELGDVANMEADEPKWSGVEPFDPPEESVKDDNGNDFIYFEPFEDSLQSRDGDFKYISMQFNPFNPFASVKVIAMEWNSDNTVCKGTYVDRDKPHPFRYDISDTRYRVHSDQWYPSFEYLPYYYNCYDLVSNFDFYSLLDVSFNDMILEPVIVEPMMTNRKPPDGYSVIGPWDGYLRLGRGERIYSPAYTNSIRSDFDSSYIEKFIDITYITTYDPILCEYHVDYSMLTLAPGEIDKIPKEYKIISSDFSNLPNSLYVKVKKKIKQKGSVVFSSAKNVFRLFIKASRFYDLDIPDEKYEFFFPADGIFFASYPRNNLGSIIYGLNCPKLHTIVSSSNKRIHEFVTLRCPKYRTDVDFRTCEVSNDKKSTLNLSIDDMEFII